jgi:hypothetical protein
VGWVWHGLACVIVGQGRKARIKFLIYFPIIDSFVSGPPDPAARRKRNFCVSIHSSTLQWLCGRWGAKKTRKDSAAFLGNITACKFLHCWAAVKLYCHNAMCDLAGRFESPTSSKRDLFSAKKKVCFCRPCRCCWQYLALNYRIRLARASSNITEITKLMTVWMEREKLRKSRAIQ